MSKVSIVIIPASGYDELVQAFIEEVNKLKDVHAEVMSIEDFTTHPFEPTEERKMLLVGDGDENLITPYVYPKIAFKLKNECGAYYGGDSRRMLICGNGDGAHRKQLKVLFDKQKRGDVDTSTPDAKTGPRFLAYVFPIITLTGIFLFGKANRRKIRMMQVTLGMERLLETLINY